VSQGTAKELINYDYEQAATYSSFFGSKPLAPKLAHRKQFNGDV
jgi:hypothetical protein